MNVRYLALAIAMAAAVVGLVLALVPGVVPATGEPGALPTVLAGGAVVAGLYRAYQWLDDDSPEPRLPEPERGRPVSVPGDDFDSLLASTPSVGTSSGDRRALKVRDELEAAAVAVLTTYRGLDRTDAHRQLDEGRWTDDPLAAEFFTSVNGTGSSFRESVAGSFWGEGPFRRRARHAASELARIAGKRGAD